MKPSQRTIVSTTSLTQLHPEFRTFEKLNRCNLCGANADPMSIWRECDERDQKLAGPAHLLIVCRASVCRRLITDHPRLYVEERMGMPGYFPLLCGPCQYRDGARCTHKDLIENGGTGLSVSLHGMPGFICGRGGCSTPPKTATDCAGRTILRVVR